MRFQRGEEGEVLNVSGASESSRRREELSGEQEEEGSFSIMLSIMLLCFPRFPLLLQRDFAAF